MFIDLGGNLLPGFADGAKDVKACAERLSVLYSAGVDAVVLTPLYYPAKRSVENFVTVRDNMLHNLLITMPRNCPALYLGCEVYVDERLKYISTIGELTVLGTRTVIVHMPDGRWEGSLIDTVEAIRAVGIDVIITHIDRYPEQYAKDLFKYGYRAIIDASAFVGISNLFRRKKYLEWIDEGYVIGIGSNFVVKKNRFLEFISKIANLLGFTVNIKTDEKNKLARIISKTTAYLGEERAEKLAEASARVLAGAVQITK